MSEEKSLRDELRKKIEHEEVKIVARPAARVWDQTPEDIQQQLIKNIRDNGRLTSKDDMDKLLDEIEDLPEGKREERINQHIDEFKRARGVE